MLLSMVTQLNRMDKNSYPQGTSSEKEQSKQLKKSHLVTIAMKCWQGLGDPLLNMLVMEGLTEKVTFKQRPLKKR